MRYRVQTRDVDGRDNRTFKTRAGAIRRFEEMIGYSIGDAIFEAYPSPRPLPTVDEAIARELRAVSQYGTVVYIGLVA